MPRCCWTKAIHPCSERHLPAEEDDPVSDWVVGHRCVAAGRWEQVPLGFNSVQTLAVRIVGQGAVGVPSRKLTTKMEGHVADRVVHHRAIQHWRGGGGVGPRSFHVLAANVVVVGCCVVVVGCCVVVVVAGACVVVVVGCCVVVPWSARPADVAVSPPPQAATTMTTASKTRTKTADPELLLSFTGPLLREYGAVGRGQWPPRLESDPLQ